jgi:hypothetical protein
MESVGMDAGLRELTLKDIVYGLVVPTIVGLVIIAFALSEPFLAQINPTLIGIFVFGVQEVIMTVGVAMLLGLVWNKWAGGASGFLLGSIYALWYSISGVFSPGWTRDISLLGYAISAMLIGYIAGALNKGSPSFPRMLFSGLVSGIAGALFLWLTLQLSPLGLVTGSFGFFVTITPRITFGILMPVFAKIFMKFGFTPKKERANVILEKPT